MWRPKWVQKSHPDPNAILHVEKEGTDIQEVTRKSTGEMNPMMVRLVEGWAMEFGITPYALASAEESYI
jgi:hypothetical protein